MRLTKILLLVSITCVGFSCLVATPYHHIIRAVAMGHMSVDEFKKRLTGALNAHPGLINALNHRGLSPLAYLHAFQDNAQTVAERERLQEVENIFDRAAHERGLEPRVILRMEVE